MKETENSIETGQENNLTMKDRQLDISAKIIFLLSDLYPALGEIRENKFLKFEESVEKSVRKLLVSCSYESVDFFLISILGHLNEAMPDFDFNDGTFSVRIRKFLDEKRITARSA